MRKEDIKKAFIKFNKLNVIVLGDVMLDSYIIGKVKRISPEAPVPVVSNLKRELRLGGAANVALNLQAMGAKPILCGIIGNDEKGKQFIKILEQHGISSEGIFNDVNRPTTVKTRIISDNHHLLRIDDETTECIDNKTEQKIIRFIEKFIKAKKADAIIFEDYDKGLFTPKIIEKVIKIANKNNVLTFVDPKKRNFLHYKKVTLFKPNFKEFTEGLKIEIQSNNYNSIFVVAKEFIKKLGILNIMITLGDRGIFVANKNEYFMIPAHSIDLTDVSGAGDTVISLTCLCMTLGLNVKEAAVIANFAGAQVCEKAGVVSINKEELATQIMLNFSVK